MKRTLALLLALLISMWMAGALAETEKSAGADPSMEPVSVLLIGIDARPGEKTGRSDTMILATMNPETNEVKLISFMRDTYVEIPGRKPNRLNAAYRYGGAELLFGALKENFGVEVDKYVTVNFSMMADLVDQIGGLELTVESEYIRDRINAVIKMDNKALGVAIESDLIEDAGTQVLNGKQVQAYARWRKGSSDFARTQRQREVIVKIMEKLKSEYSLMQLVRLAIHNLPQMYTNLTMQDVMAVAPGLLELNTEEIAQLRIPVDGGYESQTISGMAVLVPDISKNTRAIRDFLAK